MTYQERVYSMTGAALINEAEKLGVKLNKKGNTLKESKAKAADKIIAAYEAKLAELKEEAQKVAETEPTLTVPMPAECTETGLQPIEKEEATAEPKKARKRTKKTFDELVAEIPSPGNVRLIRAANGDVIVKRGNKRVFRYNGHTLIATTETNFAGLDYEAHESWNGYVIKNATADIMRAVFMNVNK